MQDIGGHSDLSVSGKLVSRCDRAARSDGDQSLATYQNFVAQAVTASAKSAIRIDQPAKDFHQG
jgi:hypothetical protein